MSIAKDITHAHVEPANAVPLSKAEIYAKACLLYTSPSPRD